MPVVSVVMLFHRVTPFLVPAVQSVLSQTLRDLELVLVDNGTGANSALFADPRVRIVRLAENLGIGAGYNAGVAAARGEFIAMLDSDDIALPPRLERQVAALRGDVRLGLVSSCADTINAAGAVIGREFALIEEGEQSVFTRYTNAAPTSSYTGRAEVFRRFPFRPEFTVATDYDFFARAAEAWPMRGLPEVLTQYRVHGGQVTATRQPAQVLHACAIRLLTARRRAGRPEESEQILAEVRGWAPEPAEVAGIYRQFARRSMADGFPLLAVYHARKAIAARRAAPPVAFAVRLLAQALRAEPNGRALLLRMFAGGPLRAHRLRRG
jgi:hypothetical protein